MRIELIHHESDFMRPVLACPVLRHIRARLAGQGFAKQEDAARAVALVFVVRLFA